jgi:hypothetical protein
MVMRPSTHKYLASSKTLLGILVALKYNSSMFMIKLAEENMDCVEQLFSIFDAPKMRLLSYRAILNTRATAIISDTARHFGNMKSDSSWMKRPSDQGYLAFIDLLFSILTACKCDYLSVLNHRIKVTWPPVQAYSAFSWFKKTRFLARR